MQFCDLLQAAERTGQRILTWSLSLTPTCLVHVGMTMMDNFKCRTAKYRILHGGYHRTWCLKTLSRTLSLNNLRKTQGELSHWKSNWNATLQWVHGQSPHFSAKPIHPSQRAGLVFQARILEWVAIPFSSPPTQLTWNRRMQVRFTAGDSTAKMLINCQGPPPSLLSQWQVTDSADSAPEPDWLLELPAWVS